MTIRYFILTAHYRSTLDFSNSALQAAQKGYKKIINGLRIAKKLSYAPDEQTAVDPEQIAQVEQNIQSAFRALSDDFNTAQAIGYLFNLLKKINSIYTGQLESAQFGEKTFGELVKNYIVLVEDILGLKEEQPDNSLALLDTLLAIYKQAKQARDYAKVDEIREALKDMGIVVKDMKNKIDWAYEE